jgi:hypothetical protein
MLALLSIQYFSIISYFYLLDDPLKNENKYFLRFYFLCGYSTQFPNTISKASSMCSAKILSQKDLKFADPILHVVKKALFLHFKHYDLTIYVVNFFETFSTPYFNSPKQYPMVESQKK